MTLSIGNVVRKVDPEDNDKFVENEVHIIFKVVGVSTIQHRDAEGNYSSVNIAELEVVK